ncbi:hypothetical protein N7492_000636 [Penicillium capsulatum]|uniref:Methyltransferase domain-containing protein n=1 Tax=Penicillium capsulatum TaxID=69766 RepID=A0A9W9IQT3_9EURO|nr:hypothetical protein N7492_000636 [Penicillium capsulatum]KAJ6130306.1 hypothetical protein N7512_003086 [Penicillium capsulatum]
MARDRPLPLAEEWQDPDTYIEALFQFAATSELFINITSGVHILDFLTREPDFYTTLLPEDWRIFFAQHDIHDIIRLLLREDITPLRGPDTETGNKNRTWNGGAFPPPSLLEYIYNVRRLTLRREPTTQSPSIKLPRHVAVGMNAKKVHEVEQFSRYVGSLTDVVQESRGEPISHIVDFGSGQNYLGRTLASAPYHKHIIAIERKHQYISGAKGMDVHARLVKAKKKVYVHNRKKSCEECGETPIAGSENMDISPEKKQEILQTPAEENPPPNADEQTEDVTMFNMLGEISLGPDELLGSLANNKPRKKLEPQIEARGKVSYIEHNISDGYLEPIIDHVVNPPPVPENEKPEETSITIQPIGNEQNDARVMVVSLHSCGNLVHHGVRSLILNPSVVAVAMIGCCYNLLTERLSPATYKLPILKSVPPRNQETGISYDPHGFPMSKYLENYETPCGSRLSLNVTARCMAVQAPYNWGYNDSEGFFTRHFFRALLQRVLVDRGVIPKPGTPSDYYADGSNDSVGGIPPLVVGSMSKAALQSFTSYARAASTKLCRHPTYGAAVQERVVSLSDEDLHRYETEYAYARKNLSVVWSLMAFSSQVVEAIIVLDRWLYLREHDVVKECWVEPVFDYSESPRNLAVIGIKR